jgi:Asp/Glu/hydantoin racemase
MNLIIIPPYQNPNINWVFIIRQLLVKLEKAGSLIGANIDIDEGYFTTNTSESRDEESRALMSVGLISKVKEYSEMGKYDAIVFTGGSDPSFPASRLAARIPIVASLHSCLHVASLIGERCGHINLTASSASTVRHAANSYGFDHKLASVRYVNFSTTYVYRYLMECKDNWADRFKHPELTKVTEAVTTQCIMAIEKDRVDSLIISVEPLQALEEEIRRRLDTAGFGEIPIVCGVAAAIEMAKTMINMSLIQTPRAYPGANLKAKPEYF